MKIFLNYTFIYLLLSSTSFAKMNSYDIEKLVLSFLKDNNINSPVSINKKLKLPTCKGNIDIENNYGNYKTLLLRCNGDKQWKYNLRTNIKVKKTFKVRKVNRNDGKNVFVLKEDLRKNHIISKKDIIKKNIKNLGSNNYFFQEDKIIGRELKLPLKKNQIIRERHLVKNWTIEEGQKVIIENNKSRINIMVDGIATKSAMEGEYLDVLNKSTGKIIKAWVKNNKKVSIFR